MDAATKRSMFCYGALGGMLPTIVTLASTYATNHETPWPAAGLYLGLALWGFAGGVVALTNTTSEMRQAIFAGMAAPAIVFNVIAGASEASMQKRKTAELLPTIGAALGIASIGMAHAQEKMGGSSPPPFAPASLEPAGTFVVTPRLRGGAPSNASIPVDAVIQRDGKAFTYKIGEIKYFDAATAFVVPQGTQSLSVMGTPVKITGTITQAHVNVVTTPTWYGDFLWAMGASRPFIVQDVTVIPEK